MTLGVITHKLQLMNGCVLGGRREEGEQKRGKKKGGKAGKRTKTNGMT